MERFDRHLLLLLPVALFAASCGTTRSTTASVDDDVYFRPSMAPVRASTNGGAAYDEPAAQMPTATPSDDYYNEDTSKSLGTDGGYYDVTYNDPYYYNYGRFGFNASPMGWQTGWNGPGWGGSMMNGMGWGSGWQGYSLGWRYGTSALWGSYRPGWVYNPYISPNPWGWNNWGYGGLGYGYGYGNGYGYGYGNYNSPWGSCYSCYSPVVIGDGSSGGSIMVTPRRPLGSSGGAVNGTRRMPVRNPVGLAPMANDRSRTFQGRRDAIDRTTRTPNVNPGRSQPVTRTDRTRERSTPSRDPGRMAPSRGFDSGGGGRFSPAPSRGGGGGGGGGVRTSPGRR
jgi:hypothetical protein